MWRLPVVFFTVTGIRCSDCTYQILHVSFDIPLRLGKKNCVKLFLKSNRVVEWNVIEDELALASLPVSSFNSCCSPQLLALMYSSMTGVWAKNSPT